MAFKIDALDLGIYFKPFFIVNDNLVRESEEKILSYYLEKGFKVLSLNISSERSIINSLLEDVLNVFLVWALDDWEFWSIKRYDLPKNGQKYVHGCPSFSYWYKSANRLCSVNKLPRVQSFTLKEQFIALENVLDTKHSILRINLQFDVISDEGHAYIKKILLWVQEYLSVSIFLCHSVAPISSKLDESSDSIIEESCVNLPCESISENNLDESLNLLLDEKCIADPIDFIGMPHLSSEVEHIVYEWLNEDLSLKNVFEFNQKIRSQLGSYFIVDLLASEERLVVEIDGYQWHSDKNSFREDRQRDYELLISQYTVLRLTAEEIIKDKFSSLEKIKKVLSYLRNKRT